MHVITNNPRVSVSHDELRAKFRLHIAGATLEDAGPYMCQINSMPVVKQVSISVFLPLYSFTLLGTPAMLSHLFINTTCWSGEIEERNSEKMFNGFQRHHTLWVLVQSTTQTVGPCAVQNTHCGSLCSLQHTLWILVQSTTHTVGPCVVQSLTVWICIKDKFESFSKLWIIFVGFVPDN